MKNPKTVIIDCNYVGHSARFAVDSNLKTKSGIHTNVIYGFLQTLITLAQTFKTNRFAFVWDSRTSKRKELYPEYKNSRHQNLTPKEKEELKIAFHQFQIIRKRVLPAMGFSNNFLIPGFEGDDLIASIINSDLYMQDFLVYASDHDLYQLLSPRVSIIRKKEIYTINKFVQEYGINPSQWWIVKMLAGCTSDDIPGIRGIGEKTACKWIRNELKKGSLAYQKIIDGKEEAEKRNNQLVRLPFPGTPICELVRDKFDVDATYKLFQYFEFESLLDEFDEWKMVMK